MYKPSKFEFSIGGFVGHSYEFSLDGDALVFKSFRERYEEWGTGKVIPSTDDWARFRKEIDENEIWHWLSKYEVPVVDGTEWSLTIEYPREKLFSLGSNGYPGVDPSVVEGPRYSHRFVQLLKSVNKLIRGLYFEDAWEEDE